MNDDTTILLVDDDDRALRSLSIFLRTNGFNNPVQVDDPTKVIKKIEKHTPSVVLLDLHMPNISGLSLLEKIKNNYPDVIVIVITADTQIDMAVKCMQLGAYDYFIKPVDHKRLIQIILKSLENKQLNDVLINIQKHLLTNSNASHAAFSPILTKNQSMLQLFKYIEAISESSRPVLILGETGTGKELFAKAVHDVSDRSGELVSVNAAGLDDTAFTDSLFGHKKGAFTGAQTSREGLIKKANHGSIFLDEIGDLKPESQIKLLRLIQENNYFPLGSDQLVINTARFITATHQDLRQLVNEGQFRRDLFYRLHIHTIYIPPLRERRDDLELLANHFLEKASKELNCKLPIISDGLLQQFEMYDFPGNVRELEMLLYDACIYTTDKYLNQEVIKQHIAENSNQQINDEVENNWNDFSKVKTLPTIKDATESLINEALARTNKNQKEASKILGITRQALNKRLIRRK